MDLTTIQESIVTKVYHIKPEMKVPLHKHDGNDEIFYCIKGSGFGILQNNEVELEVGKAFIVKSGIMHSLRTDRDMYVCSFLIPVIDETE